MRIYYLFLISCLLVTTPVYADWPEFRGPWSNGRAAKPGDPKPVGLPLHWSETENIKWKTAIPHRGWSTPVTLDNQIWLTTATTDGHDFYAICVDADTGKIRHELKLFHVDKPESLGNAVNCYASPSPTIEPGRVYVHFGSYGTACLDTATGKVVWERKDLPCRHYRGPASSVILFNDLLIVTLDGVDLQYVVALNKKTGETMWKTNRSTEFKDLGGDGKPKMDGDMRKAFGTPLIIDVNGKPLMISVGAWTAFGYDPQTGREVWKVRLGSHSHTARPVFGQGLAFISTGIDGPEFMAIRVDGQGDVTNTHVAWKTIQGARACRRRCWWTICSIF